MSRQGLGRRHDITVVNPVDHFQFTLSNPRVAVGWRTLEQVVGPLPKPLARKDIKLVVQAVSRIEPEQNQLQLADGSTLSYDFSSPPPAPGRPSTKCRAWARSRAARCQSAIRRMPSMPVRPTKSSSGARAPS